MKKILLILTVFFTLPLMAQEILTFKGIPVGGSHKSFVRKLQKEGMIIIGKSDMATVLEGGFGGFPKAIVLVPRINKKVVQVGVYSPKINPLFFEEQYNEVVDSYKKKYGNPINEIHEVIGKRPTNAIELYHALAAGKINYRVRWEVGNGFVRIELIPNPIRENESQLMIDYCTKQYWEDSVSAKDTEI